MRTEAQIQAELEARLAEIEAEAAQPQMKWPCDTCRWQTHHECKNPLVMGLKAKPLPNVQWQIERWPGDRLSDNWPSVRLCGPEKALWQEKEKRWRDLLPHRGWEYFGVTVVVFGIPLFAGWLTS